MHHRPTRPKSAKGRNRPNRYRQSSASITVKPSASVVSTSSSNEEQLHNPSNVLSQVPDHPTPSNNSDQSIIIQQQQERFPTVPRSSSSLSKYRILPSISTGPSSIQIQQQFSDPGINPNVDPFIHARMEPEMESFYSKSSYGEVLHLSESLNELQVSVGHELPLDLEIALRLPDADGTRVKKLFSSTSTPKDLLHFAYESKPAAVRSPELCDLFFTNLEGKKERIKDVEKSLQQLGIADRSLLYVEWNCYDDEC